MTIRGSCLCGKVVYEIEGRILSAGHCHCSQCQRAHGAAFGTYADFNTEQFRWVNGEELVKTYTVDQGGYCFCTVCGSNVAGTWQGKIVNATFGTFHGDPETRPDHHIFVGSKGVWDKITDDLPQYDERPRETTDGST